MSKAVFEQTTPTSADSAQGLTANHVAYVCAGRTRAEVVEYTPEERSRISIAQERIRNQVKVCKSCMMLTELIWKGLRGCFLGVMVRNMA